MIIVLQVDSKAKPAFPRQTSVWWFDCKSAQNTPTLGLSADLRSAVHVNNNDGHETINMDGDSSSSLFTHARIPVTVNNQDQVSGLSSNRFEINKEAEFVSPKQLRGHQNPEERFLTHESEHELHEHDQSYTNPHIMNSDNKSRSLNRESGESEGHHQTSGSRSSLSSIFSINLPILATTIFFLMR